MQIQKQKLQIHICKKSTNAGELHPQEKQQWTKLGSKQSKSFHKRSSPFIQMQQNLGGEGGHGPVHTAAAVSLEPFLSTFSPIWLVRVPFFKANFWRLSKFFPPPTWHKWWPELPFRTSCKNGRMCAPWLNQATSLKYSRLKSLEKILIWQHFLFCLLWDIWLQIWEDYRISAKGFGDNVAEILVCPQSGKKGNFQCSKTLIDLDSTFHITLCN